MAQPQPRYNPFTAPALAASYDAWFETPLGRVVDRLERDLIYRLARPRAGERALDVGTGTGHYACELARRGLRVVGCDPSAAMLQEARAKGAPVTWQEGRAEALPFADGTFDLVLAVTTLEFVEEPQRALAEMVRVAAPGGRVVVATLNAVSSWGRAYLAEAQRQETPFRYAHLLTPGEFLALLRPFGRPRWSSAVFIPPSGRGLAWADLLEGLGRTFARGRGALLVGRIEK